MGLSQALYSAISGLTNHQRAMDNIGNNLANVNTVAFKKGVFQFRTLLEQTLRGGMAADTELGRGVINPLAVGLGTQTGSINKDFNQGSFETTGNQRDMAIDGNGYFVLRNGNSNVYTRDGTFYLGSDGSLLGGNGLSVQGVLADKNGDIPQAGEVTDLVIPIGQTGAATETTQVSLTGNLDSRLSVAPGNTIATAAAAPAAITDSTWITGNVSTVNVGHVETSAALRDVSSTVTHANGDPATMATDLANLEFMRGSVWVRPFAGINAATNTLAERQITMSWNKGGRLQTSTFTYGASPNGDGTTLQALMDFLGGGVNEDATTANNRVLDSGAMGLIRVQATTAAVDGYDSPTEQAGAFFRQYFGGHDQSVDYDAPYTGASDMTSRVSIASNLGTENEITDIAMTYSNIKYTDIFDVDAEYGGKLTDTTSTQQTEDSTSTNMVVYDSLGNPKTVNMQMVLVDRDTNFSTWRWVAESIDDTDATWLNGKYNGVNGAVTSVNVGTGLIRFDSEGRFVAGSELSLTSGIEITLEGKGVNNPLQIKINEGLTADQTQNLDFGALTQVAATSDFNLKDQDGSAPGTLDSFTVTADGVIQGVYSNGVVQNQGRLVVALVPNETGMISSGNNLYFTTPASGDAQVSFAGVGGRGTIRSGTLESSNVDLSEEFTKLITTERGFQANARVISTSDEMLVELVNLKR